MAGPAVIPDGSGSGAEMFPLEIFFPDGPDAVSFPELDEASAMSFPRRFRLSLGAGRAEPSILTRRRTGRSLSTSREAGSSTG